MLVVCLFIRYDFPVYMVDLVPCTWLMDWDGLRWDGMG